MVYIGLYIQCKMSLLNEAYRLRYTCRKRKAQEHLDDVITRAEQAFQAQRAKAEAEFRTNGLWSYSALLNTTMATLTQQYADETVGKEANVLLPVAVLKRIRNDCF